VRTFAQRAEREAMVDAFDRWQGDMLRAWRHDIEQRRAAHARTSGPLADAEADRRYLQGALDEARARLRVVWIGMGLGWLGILAVASAGWLP
jgi:hypothetical protein